MRKGNRKENGRRDMSLRKELVYLLIIALVLGMFNFNWAGVRNAVGINGNAAADELYIVEAKEAEDEDFLDEDEFYDDDYGYDEVYGAFDDAGEEVVFGEEDIYSGTDESGDGFEEDVYDDEWDDDYDDIDDDYDDIDDEDYDDADDEAFDDEDDYDEDWDEDDEDDWDDEDDADEEYEDSEDAYGEMPAGVLYQESENGVRVRADFDEDVFPAGAYMELTDISRSEALEAAGDVVDNAVDAAGVDIAFFSEGGEEIESEDDGEVRVILSLAEPLAKGSGQTVVHVGDDGGATELSDEEVIASSYKSVVFTATEFSLYLVVATEKTVEVVTPSAVSPSKTVTASVVFSSTPIGLVEGTNKTLSVKFKSEAEITSVNWTENSNGEIVKGTKNDDNTYTIEAVKAGSAKITATVADGDNVFIAEMDVTVADISISPSKVSMEKIGDTQELTVNVSGVSVSKYEWTYNNKYVSMTGTSSDKCTITAKAVGNTEVTVAVTDTNRNKYTQVCPVDITTVAVTGVTVTPSVIEVKRRNTSILTATVAPEDATNKTVSWTSNNESVATVDKNGKVTAVVPGAAKITATTENGGKTGDCNVTVTGIVLDNASASMSKGSKLSLSPMTKVPSAAGSSEVKWSSSDAGVATVTDSGEVTAVAKGQTDITATLYVDGEVYDSATRTVTVTDTIVPVTGVTVSPTALSLKKGDETMLSATVSPATATNQNVVWESSNTSVATVSEKGIVKAMAEGTATIKAIADENNAVNGTCTVTVMDSVDTVKVTSVELDRSKLSLEKDDAKMLTATVLPSNATNQNVNWSSSNTSVAWVDQSGRVSAVGVGEAKITVTSAADSSISDTCTVTVWTSYQVTTSDSRSDKTATVEAVGVSGADDENMRLIISDITASDKTKLQNLISGNALSYSVAPYFFELDLVDENNNKVSNDDFGACLVTMKLPSGMSASGDVQVVSVTGGGTLDTLLSRTGTIGGVANCVQFRADHFSPFAILYAAKSSGTGSSPSGSGYNSGSSNGSTVRYVYVDDDDDDDDDDSSSGGDSYTPDIKQVRWWGADKSTFYWAEKKAVTGYRLQYSTDAGFKKSKTKAINSKKKNVTVTGMEKNKKYYVRVRAYKKSADGKTTTWKSWSHRVIVKRKH